MFIYSRSVYLVLRDQRNDPAYGDLIGYFYTSTAYVAGTTSVQYSVRTLGRYFYISVFEPATTANSTGKILFVKKFEKIQGKLYKKVFR